LPQRAHWHPSQWLYSTTYIGSACPSRKVTTST
jgi:hypothetical protein